MGLGTGIVHLPLAAASAVFIINQSLASCASGRSVFVELACWAFISACPSCTPYPMHHARPCHTLPSSTTQYSAMRATAQLPLHASTAVRAPAAGATRLQLLAPHCCTVSPFNPLHLLSTRTVIFYEYARNLSQIPSVCYIDTTPYPRRKPYYIPNIFVLCSSP